MTRIFRGFSSVSAYRAVGIGAFAVASTGCSADGAPSSDPAHRAASLTGTASVVAAADAGPGDDGTGDEPPSADGGEAGTYLLGKFLFAEDETATTAVAAASASDPAELARFEPGAGGLIVPDVQLPVPFGNDVFVTDALAPEIVRYHVGADGTLVESGRLSFAETGIDLFTGWQVSIASATKAYLFDTPSLRVIVWDPSTLTVTGELELSLAAREGYTFDVGAREARSSNGLLYVPGYWYSDEDFSSLKTSGVVVIDPATDELSLAEDSRCAAYSLVVQPNGDVHMFPDGYFAQEFYLDLEAPRAPTCSVTLRAGSREFDPDGWVDLGALVGGDEFVGGAVQGGVGDGRGGIFIAVGDEQRYLDGEANVYRWWRWDVAAGTATELGDTPYWSAYMGSYTTGDQVFSILPGDESTLVIEASKEPLAAFELPGWVEVFTRLSPLE
ncbi:MAG TPA: hypothetical protein VMG12_08330 [Polyangiaceae bacterium]|nr:hypothetical protein [Polyangiaceae bacterium]